ncbi:MAG TPA: cation-translocating P-type ATPase [Acidimicrobiia bacterium]|nr:cation-translocating P-type ATPase [Acidimicrobiia bacterium]
MMRRLLAGTAHRRWLVVGGSALLIALAWLAGWLWPGTVWYTAGMLAATAVAGFGIARRALADLRNRVVGIELLVTIAVVGAIPIGVVWEAAAVTFLFRFGAALEALTLSRTRRALSGLLDLAPTVAIVLRNGSQVEVDPSEVETGELVLVKPGARFPVDGTVSEGAASVDEASITGESMPVEKTAGDRVFAGTVVADGTVVVEATGVGADTTLARIIHRVEEAQEAKAPAQRFMERFARWYTPGVVALAVGAFVFTRNVELALTLLVIGCPGALVISIPVSVVAGIGRAARRGILIKGGEYLETAGRVTTLAFDKTGTLTTGRPRLEKVLALDDAFSETDLLALAGAAETMSEHPLAAPIVAGARERSLPIPDRVDGFVQHAGRGVEALVEGRRVVVGTARLMDELGIAREDSEKAVAAVGSAGMTAVLLAVDGRVRGVLGIADQIRPEAPQAVRAVRESGVRNVLMLTGDGPRVAETVATEVGVDEVRASLLPEDKLTAVRDLQEKGHVVAMVGDGVNDAPALAAADIGMAMGAAGSDIAVETADVAIMSDRLDAVTDAIALSRRTAANLRQNVAVALVTVAFLLAGVLAGHVHMASGMLVHQASVLIVILNATRLLRSPLPSDRMRSSGEGRLVEQTAEAVDVVVV